jgi:phage terminase small subunit
MGKLSQKQLKAIPYFVSSSTVSEGAKNAGITAKTYYAWMKNPDFAAELQAQRDVVKNAALETLEKSMTKAVDKLVELLDTKDERVRRGVCNDIIELVFRHKENKELARRLAVIEEKLDI